MCLPKSKRRRVMTVMTCRPWPMGRCFALSVLLGVGVGQHDGGVVPAQGDEVVLSTFGPENCIDISRSVKGTCIFTTTCSQVNITDTNFAFVCFNPGTTMPHAMHSFGRGALESEETFDTGVRCKTCSTTEAAFASGQISRALKVMPSDTVPTDVLPVSAVPAYNDATISTQRVAGTRTTVAREAVKVQNTVSLDTVLHDVLPVSAVPAYTDVSIPSPPPCERRKEVAKEPCEVAKPCEAKRNMRPADATFYGPENCVMTFRSATGTCIVETDCADVNLTSFNMGVTCVENEQVHTRYLFGEGSFDSLEVFDSGIYCDVCLGVSEDTFRVNNILPVDVKPVSVGAPSIDVVIQSQQVGTPLANDVVPIKQDTMDATTADVQSVASNNDAVIQPQQVGNNDAVIQPQQVGTPVANDSVPAQKEMAPNIDGTTLMKTVLAKDIEALSSDVSVLEKDVVNASKQMNMPVPRPRRAASPFISRSSGWSSAKVSESWRSSSAGSASSGSSSASGPIASSASGSSRSSSGSQSSGSSSASGSRSSSSANGSRPSPAPRPSTTVKPDTAKASAKARPTPR
eukprot:TRINITY_DN5072_c0_g2_i2.p1 TRINITY_DN5072_c0_g2~~TRINITY_DN5072_c0_g2_i2.p1  ORF type:complete len:573 (+),score=110.97 TRINITY_DN5072_c0_g2_i2:74-1792(+)